MSGGTKVLFLGGLGRSGTTLLERSLGDGRRLLALGEVVHLWDRCLTRGELCGCGKRFSECAFWIDVGSVAFGGWDRVDPERMAHLKGKVDRVLHTPKISTGLGSAAFRRELTDYVSHFEAVYAAARQVSGADAVIDSSKQASLAHCLLTSETLDLRVVHCIRDPRAVAYSWTKVVARPEAQDDELGEMTRYRPQTSAFYWNLHNTAIQALRLKGGSVLTVKYEDFLAAPRAEIARINAFAEVSPASARPGVSDTSVDLEVQHSCSGNPMRFTTGTLTLRRDDDWVDALALKDKRLVTTLTLPLLKRFGYPISTKGGAL